MKAKTNKSIKSDLTIPNTTISIDEFVKQIKKAEKGPFYTIEESKQILEQMRQQRESAIK